MKLTRAQIVKAIDYEIEEAGGDDIAEMMFQVMYREAEAIGEGDVRKEMEALKGMVERVKYAFNHEWAETIEGEKWVFKVIED
ncbi:hypothetical protein ACWIG4_30270 [Streptomyces sp. NPDC002248]